MFLEIDYPDFGLLVEADVRKDHKQFEIVDLDVEIYDKAIFDMHFDHENQFLKEFENELESEFVRMYIEAHRK